MNAGKTTEPAHHPGPTTWSELKSAGLYSIALVAVLIFISFTVFSAHGFFGTSTLGPYGDSFGALTSLFNALAFAALVATVVLQSRELRDSRRTACKKWPVEAAAVTASSVTTSDDRCIALLGVTGGSAFWH